LGFWLIFKGFQPAAYAGRTEVVTTAAPVPVPATAAL
jgi:hypothetical protein